VGELMVGGHGHEPMPPLASLASRTVEEEARSRGIGV
jgi:hypothetical protein